MSSNTQKQREDLLKLQKFVSKEIQPKKAPVGAQQNLSKNRSSSAIPTGAQDGKVKKTVQSDQEKSNVEQQKKKFNLKQFSFQPKDDLTQELAAHAKERETQKAQAEMTLQVPRDPTIKVHESNAITVMKDTLMIVEKKLLSAQNKLARASLGQQKAEVKGFNENHQAAKEEVKEKQVVERHNKDHIVNTADHSDIKHSQKILFGSTATQTAAKTLGQDTTPVDKTSQFTLNILGESDKQKTPTQFNEKQPSKDTGDFFDGPTTDEQGNRLSILPNKVRPKIPSTKKKTTVKSAVPKKPSVKGVKQTKTSTRKSIASKPKEEQEVAKERDSKEEEILGSKLKQSKPIQKTGQQRTNFVRMNMKAYKPRLRGAQFTNKMMAKKRNALNYKDRFKKKMMIEQAQNRDQVNSYGGLGKVGLDYEGGLKTDENNKDLVPGFSASALKYVKKIAQSEHSEEENLDSDLDKLGEALEKIDEDVKEEESEEEVKDGDFDKARHKVPEDDAGYLKILQERFGHQEFKSGQLEAIKLLLEKKENTLVVLATGGGKSLVFQYVSLFITGLVLVVTPLISLMTDQLQKLPKFIPGASLNSQQPYSLKRQVIQAVQDKLIKVLFVSPEKLFIEDLSRYNRRIAMVCVDEIHCSSEWSHNFRPAYLKLNDMIREKVSHANRVFTQQQEPGLKKSKGKLDERCVILGLTATATKATQASICKIFEIKHPDNIITEPNLARINLSLSITRDPEKLKGLLSLLQTGSFKKLNSILIFATHKATCDRLASHLNQNGINSASYHAGKTDYARQAIQKNFISNNIRVLVCTIAFSMGIDKSDIQSVIHYDMPKSIENYVQEIGRAGRDGKLARCHMFLNNDDFYQIRRLVLTDILDQQSAIRLTNSIIVESKKKVYQIMKGLSQQPKASKNLKKRKAQDISGEEQKKTDDNDILMEKFQHEQEIASLYKQEEGQPQRIDLEDIPNIMNADDPKVYLFMDVKQTCHQLDLKKEVVLTMFNCLEKLPGSFFKLQGILPDKLGVRFHRSTPEDMAEKDDFIAQYLKHSKNHQGVWGASVANVAYEMGIDPFQVPKILFNLQNNGKGDISYETDNDCFVLKLTHIPHGGQTISMSLEMLAETRRIEKNMIQKLNCMYFVAKKVSLPNVDFMLKKEKSEDKDGGLDMYTRFSKELNDLINLYFTISKEENMEIQIAGSEEERNVMMPLVYINSHREKANVESEIKAILRDYHEGESANREMADRMKALDIVKILMGIYSDRVTVKRYMNESKFYAQFQDYDYEDLFKVATNVVSDFYINMMSGGSEQGTKKRKLNE